MERRLIINWLLFVIWDYLRYLCEYRTTTDLPEEHLNKEESLNGKKLLKNYNFSQNLEDRNKYNTKTE